MMKSGMQPKEGGVNASKEQRLRCAFEGMQSVVAWHKQS